MRDYDIDKILEEGASSLDITPSMFKEAASHYGAMGSFLENNGIEADVYPVGSIVMGTIVRPLSDDEDAYFDIDVIVERTDVKKSTCAPADVRGPIEGVLISSDRYGDKVKSCDECITLEYVMNGVEGGFRLDLDASVHDADDDRIYQCPTYPEYAGWAISIARKSADEWLGSNPRGLCEWFRDKNERFASVGKAKRREMLFRNNKKVYASIEDVPDDMDRSSLQRAVQILKRSRDEFYRRCGSKDKPASFALAIMCANLSDALPDEASALSILKHFVSSMLGTDQNSSFVLSGLSNESDKWYLENPVYGENILANWNNHDAELFFRWMKDLDLSLNDLESYKEKRDAAIEALFGKTMGRKLSSAGAVAVAVPSIIPSKPWCS